jgi:hypothetical protein
MDVVKVEDFHFGKLEYFPCYVIGTLNQNTLVTTDVAKVILNAIKTHFGKNKVVYISNREMSHNVDLSVYKLIDPKKMVGIALVSSQREELIVSATMEQAHYKGSFGVFNTLESAISWAKSFIDDDEDSDCS